MKVLVHYDIHEREILGTYSMDKLPLLKKYRKIAKQVDSWVFYEMELDKPVNKIRKWIEYKEAK